MSLYCRHCTDTNCLGNRLRDLKDGTMQFWLPHHKESAKWGGKIIKFSCPQSLIELLDTYLKECRYDCLVCFFLQHLPCPVLVTKHGCSVNQHRQCLTVNSVNHHLLMSKTGLPIRMSNFSSQFQSILNALDAPGIFPPQVSVLVEFDNGPCCNEPGVRCSVISDNHLPCPPQKTRHIFIEERLGTIRVPGPEDHAAAMVSRHRHKLPHCILHLSCLD